jgi:hypothetical protein
MSLLVPDYEIYRKPSYPIDPASPEENRDYIEADRFNMLDFRGRYLFIKNQDSLKLISIFEQPSVNRNTLRLIEFRTECYNVTKNTYIDEDVIQDIASWYTEARKDYSILDLHENPDTHLLLVVARYYMVPQDLYLHFRNFDPLNDTHERYERSQAIQALLNHNIAGTWLLRHSSYNRPQNPNTLADIIRFGIRYYVLSYSKQHPDTMIIKHILITFEVTVGWSSTADDTLIFPNFLDCLEHILQTYKLRFSDLYGDYFL